MPHKCCYINCSSNRKQHLTLFRFPTKDEPLAKLWQKNCGNLKIASLSMEALTNKLVCEYHFHPSDFRISGPRKILTKGAVPIEYVVPEPEDTSQKSHFKQPATKTYLARSALSTHAVSSSSTNTSEELKTDNERENKVMEIQNVISYSNQKETRVIEKEIVLNDKQVAKDGRTRKSARFSNQAVLNTLLKHRSASARTFISSQCFHTSKTKWTHSEKRVALSFFYKSPSNYQFMLNHLKFTLPSIKRIQSWLSIYHLQTGLGNSLREKLIEKVKIMTAMEKQCVVLFDELSLKRKLDYNNRLDFIEGYQDLGNKLGRSNKLADRTLVFMIRGLLCNWQVPYCYFVSDGTLKSSVLKEFIRKVFLDLFDIGLNPKVLVCDSTDNNRNALNLLGASSKQPTIYIGNNKVFTLFDAPNLLINLWNHFMNSKLSFEVDENDISWKDITDVFELYCKSETNRTMHQVTDAHLKPNDIQKRSVEFAAQIFNNWVALTIEAMYNCKQLKSITALSTASFIRTVSNLFDCLNSSFLDDPNPYRRPVAKNNRVVIDTLKTAYSMFDNITVSEYKIIIESNIHYIDDFQWSIKSILLLWESLNDIGTKFLYTSYLNLDPLRNLFVDVKTRNKGCNITPSVKEFRIATQKNIRLRLQISLDDSNCEIDNPLLLCNMRTATISDADFQNSDVLLDSRNGDTEESIEVCSNFYLAGYIAYKVLQKFNCVNCQNSLIKAKLKLSSPKELLLLSRNFADAAQITFLQHPTLEFTQMIAFTLREYNKLFSRYQILYDIKLKISNNLIELVRVRNDWFHSMKSCVEHKTFAIRTLVDLMFLKSIELVSKKAIKKITTSCD